MRLATLEDLPLLYHYLPKEGARLSTYSPALLMMWRDYFRLALHEEAGTLLCRLAYDGKEDSYLFPMGLDPMAAVDRLVCEARREGRPLSFFGLDLPERDALLARFPKACVSYDRGESDYLYDTASLATFPGRRYGGQRNHLNRFSRLYPDHTVEAITEENAPSLLPFLDEFAALHAERPLFREELAMTREVLLHYRLYGMDGILLRVGDKPVAFAAGKVMGGTLSVHIEKADVRIGGSYQKIVSAFASRYDPLAVPYINREDDMGSEGLRTSKLSYHPVSILEKWRMKIPPEAL